LAAKGALFLAGAAFGFGAELVSGGLGLLILQKKVK